MDLRKCPLLFQIEINNRTAIPPSTIHVHLFVSGSVGGVGVRSSISFIHDETVRRTFFNFTPDKSVFDVLPAPGNKYYVLITHTYIYINIYIYIYMCVCMQLRLSFLCLNGNFYVRIFTLVAQV